MDDINGLFLAKDYGKYFSEDALLALANFPFWLSSLAWFIIIKTFSYIGCLIWAFKADKRDMEKVDYIEFNY